MKTVFLFLMIVLTAACAARPAVLPGEPAASPAPSEAGPAAAEPEPSREPAGKPSVEPSPATGTARTPAAPSQPVDKAPAVSRPPETQPAAPQIAMGIKPPAPEPGLEPPMTDERLQKLIALAELNDERLLEVFVGMYRKTVQAVMGFSRQNPYKREMITGLDGAEYEILFYLTREPRRGKGITERQLTPVIFRDDRVVAMGQYPLKKLRRTGTVGKIKLPPPDHLPAQ